MKRIIDKILYWLHGEVNKKPKFKIQLAWVDLIETETPEVFKLKGSDTRGAYYQDTVYLDTVTCGYEFWKGVDSGNTYQVRTDSITLFTSINEVKLLDGKEV